MGATNGFANGNTFLASSKSARPVLRCAASKMLDSLTLPMHDLPAIAVVAAIRGGDLAALAQLLRDQPALANARLVDERGVARTLLHVVADWPGHLVQGRALVEILLAAGADVNAHLICANMSSAPETALHWAASSDDVAVLDALLDHGANIEAPGAVFTGGTAMSDAVVFAQWHAARRLLARGALTTLWQAAALGLVDRVHEHIAAAPLPTAAQLQNALWHACRGGQLAVAELLLACGADPNWRGYDNKTALDVALELQPADAAQPLVALLRASDAQRFAALSTR